MTLFRNLVGLLLLVAAALPAHAKDHWVATWGAGAVKMTGEAIPEGGVTYRNVVRTSLAGRRVRVTLSNIFGTQPLRIGGVSIAQSVGVGQSGIKADTLRPVTFGGKTETVIAPGALVISDAADIMVPPLGDLAVTVFLPEQQVAFYTGHAVTHATNFRMAGNQLRAAAPADAAKTTPWRVATAVDVVAPPKAAAIVVFGDSITGGSGTTPDTNRRYPNMLAARLQADPRYAHLAVVNAGIGSNRILGPAGDPASRVGQHPSGLDRWSSDALDRAGVKYIILLEGVNDLGRSSRIREGRSSARLDAANEKPVTAEELIAAMTTMIDQAHKRGVKVIGGVMTPYRGAGYHRPEGEMARQKINDFIRTSGKFDGVVDFEKALGDPADPSSFHPAFNKRDRLHPNDAGAKAMANAVDLDLFK